MAYTVYILYSEKHNRHYVGYTSNLENRLLSHNELGTKGFTAKYRPWKLVYSESFEYKTEAIRREKWLKTGHGRDFIKTIKN